MTHVEANARRLLRFVLREDQGFVSLSELAFYLPVRIRFMRRAV